MSCRCLDLQELWDEDAKSLIREHLEKIEVRADGWEAVYRCPNTGATWLRDYPHSERHGGGPLRLRRLDESADDG